RPGRDENGSRNAADLAADAGTEVVHLDGRLRLQRRRIRHVCRGAGNRPLHPGGCICAGLSAAAGAVDPLHHGPPGPGESDGDCPRLRVPGADPVGKASPAGAGTGPERCDRRAGRLSHRDQGVGTEGFKMTRDEMLAKVRAACGAAPITTSEFRDNFRVLVPVEAIIAALPCLKDECGFDMLPDRSGIDYLHYPEAKDRYAVVYCLTNTATGERLVVKTFANDPDPTIPSCFPLWKGADWMEREVFDMYGVVFTGHPDLRRI